MNKQEFIAALQEKMPAFDGNWKISDLIQRSANQLAESFQTGELMLRYN